MLGGVREIGLGFEDARGVALGHAGSREIPIGFETLKISVWD